MTAASTGPRPMPPWSAGVSTPQNPACRAFSCSARSSWRSRPCCPCRSRRSTSGSSGMISRWAKVRTQSRTCSCSLVNAKSTEFPPSPCYPRLPARPTGNVDHLAGYERRVVADQERDDTGDVLRAADPGDRDLAGRRLLELLEVHADPGRGGGGHVGDDEAGGHRVGGHAELAELDRQRLGEPLHAGLGGG